MLRSGELLGSFTLNKIAKLHPPIKIIVYAPRKLGMSNKCIDAAAAGMTYAVAECLEDRLSDRGPPIPHILHISHIPCMNK